MKNALQRFLLRSYRTLLATGFLSTRPGRYLFTRAYSAYKSAIEARYAGHLRGTVAPGSWVIDAGANIGFFTLRFGRWVSGGGKVVAVEPEGANCAALTAAVAAAGLSGTVEIVRGAVAESSGTRRLAVNPYDPADHRLGKAGIPVEVFSIDDILARRGWPAVSLIKADVQGAEFLVLSGARETLKRFRPALYLEVDDEALASFGASAGALLALLRETGYAPYHLGPKGITGPLSLEEALRMQKAARYIDLLFLHPHDQ